MNANLLEALIILYTSGIFVVGMFTALSIQEIRRKKKKEASPHNNKPHKYSGLINKTAHYRQNIEKLAADRQIGVHSHRLEKVLASFDAWETHIHLLVKRLLKLESNKIIQHERSVLPDKIRNIKIHLAIEQDPRLQKELQETLDSYLRQETHLDNLQFLMEKTRLDLEEFIADIGAIYSQLQTLEAMDVRSRRAQRLAHEIEEERSELDDLLTAMYEIYGSQ